MLDIVVLLFPNRLINMNKRVENFRVGQLIELTEAKKSLERIDNKIAEIFRARSNEYGPERNSFNPELRKMYAEERRLKNLIEFLTTELLEKKYANHYGYSDVNPYEVIEERTEKLYIIRAMKSTETPESIKERQNSFVPGGFCGHFNNEVQDWVIESDESAPLIQIRLHKDGSWRDSSGARYGISAEPVKFYDFNF